MASEKSKLSSHLTIAGVVVAVLSGVITLVHWFVLDQTRAAIAPVNTKLEQHMVAPGHPTGLEEMKKVRDDVAYIRGQLDRHFGPMSDKK